MTDRDPDTDRWLAAAVLVGAVLRVWGLWFGLPHTLARPDEVEAVSYALNIARGDLNPHFFHWPSLHLYVLGFLFRADLALRAAFGLGGEAPPFGHLVLIGRAYVAAAGTLTIPLVFLLARQTAGAFAAIGAATLLAVAPLHVRDSHFAMADVTMTCLVIGSLWLIVDAHEGLAEGLRTRAAAPWSHGLRVAAAAGFVGGLAVGTKYSAAAIVAAAVASQTALALSTPLRWKPATWMPLALFLACCAAGFLVATPYALLDAATFRADLLFDVAHLARGHEPDVGPGWSRHLTFSLPHGMGAGAFIAACAGLLAMIFRGTRPLWLVAVFALAFYAGIGRGRTVFARYALPLVPVGCLMAGVGVEVVSRLRGRVALVFPLLLMLVAAPSAVNSVWLDVLLSRTDTRVLAARWLSERLPPDSTIYESGREYVGLDIRSPRLHRWYYDPATAHFAGASSDMLPDCLILHRSPVEAYTAIPPRIDALAAARYTPIRVFQATRGDGNPADYDLQDAFFLPLAGFWNVLRPGPTITVYLRRDRDPGWLRPDGRGPAPGTGARPSR